MARTSKGPVGKWPQHVGESRERVVSMQFRCSTIMKEARPAEIILAVKRSVHQCHWGFLSEQGMMRWDSSVESLL